MKIFCNDCRYRTDHRDFGVDVRPDRRYRCEVCGATNDFDDGEWTVIPATPNPELDEPST